jgi:hypothetical protein
MAEQKKRWYDVNPIIADAIHAWENFPPSLQRALAEHLNELIKSEELPFRYKGFSRLVIQILIFNDSRKRQRWCDQDRVVQKAYNSLGHTELSALLDVSMRIVKLRSYVRDKPLDPTRMPQRELRKAIAYVFEHPDHI